MVVYSPSDVGAFFGAFCREMERLLSSATASCFNRFDRANTAVAFAPQPPRAPRRGQIHVPICAPMPRLPPMFAFRLGSATIGAFRFVRRAASVSPLPSARALSIFSHSWQSSLSYLQELTALYERAYTRYGTPRRGQSIPRPALRRYADDPPAALLPVSELANGLAYLPSGARLIRPLLWRRLPPPRGQHRQFRAATKPRGPSRPSRIRDVMCCIVAAQEFALRSSCNSLHGVFPLVHTLNRSVQPAGWRGQLLRRGQ